MRLFKIIADYRPVNGHNPQYYILENNKSNAQRKFSSKFSYMKIYEIKEVLDKDSQLEILMNPEHYIYW